jgi:hypothetical protein
MNTISLLGFLFGPEDEGYTTLENVGNLLPHYKCHIPGDGTLSIPVKFHHQN